MTTAQQEPKGLTTVTDSKSGTGQPGISFRPDIEGLRAVAVLLVVFGHAGMPFLSGGYVGVDVFFVISGFLITTLLVKELHRTGSISIKGFYARRATRLLPASALVLVATLVAAWLWLPATRMTSIAGDAVASSLYAINYRLAFAETDYFNADAGPSPMQHFWSLAVEEQFYFGWPLLLLLIGGTVLWRRRQQASRGRMAAALAVIFAGSLALSVLQSPVSTSWAYFGIHTRAWELAAGALVAVFASSMASMPRAVAVAATWGGMAMVVTAAVSFTEQTVFPGYAALLPVAGTALAIAGGCADPRGGAGMVLNRRPLQFVGKLSYGYYLWHWPVLMIAPAALDHPPTLRFNLAAALGALLLAWVSYHLVENPIRTRKSLKVRPWRGIAVGAGLTAATAAVAVAAAVVLPMTMFKGPPAENPMAVMSRPSAGVEELQELISDSEEHTAIPANLTPDLEEVEDDRPAVYDDGCNLEITDERTANRICEYGDTESDTTVVLFGDSHAAQWFPALDKIGKEKGWKVVPLTRSGCPVADVDIVHEVLNRRYTECRPWREDSFKAIRKLDPELVITTSINGHAPVGPGDKRLEDPDQVMRDGWKRTFDHLQAASEAKVVYLVDTPNFRKVVPDCVAENLEATDRCAIARNEAMLRPARTELITTMAADRDISVIDPVPWFCVENVCPAIIGNMLVIRDSNHITTPYVESLSPLLEEKLPDL